MQQYSMVSIRLCSHIFQRMATFNSVNIMVHKQLLVLCICNCVSHSEVQGRPGYTVNSWRDLWSNITIKQLEESLGWFRRQSAGNARPSRLKCSSFCSIRSSALHSSIVFCRCCMLLGSCPAAHLVGLTKEEGTPLQDRQMHTQHTVCSC